MKLVRDELLTTIETSARDIEDFFGSSSDGSKLQASIEGLQQITGTLAMIQLSGPHQLAASILEVAQDITPGDKTVAEGTLQSLTNAFFVLPRYLEFLENTKTDHPELLLPWINELRACCGKSALPDSHFFKIVRYPASVANLTWIKASSQQSGDLKAAATRLRHMYQIGLVALLQNKPVKPPLKMMSIALERLTGLYSKRPVGVLFAAGELAIKASLSGRAELSMSRRKLLMLVEKLIRTLIKTDVDASKTVPPKQLYNEFVYWCAISPISAGTDQKINKLLTEFGISRANYTDKQLQKEAEILSGPSLNTIQSVISVFEEEIESAKRMLELSAQAQSTADFDTLVDLLKKLADILAVIGLTKPSIRLKEQAKVISGLHATGGQPDRAVLSEVADAFLQIESSVVLFKNQAGYQSGETQDADVAIADRQLAEAELIVLQEAETGLLMVKRALSAFAESNYDTGHIRNVAKTLGTIKGGMTLLHRQRCAQVLALAEKFIEEELLGEDHPAVLQQLLETFADCIVSLEYYVTALQSDKNTDDSILQIAETSLSSLGLIK
ncbi:hypothetical protein [Halioxenophilus sp. WMMB6]|uniref:hypothetical protein n=1 Tax=Halioxenophilus sp. WMMB6 TaxID=3073815 RepID=UPI00295E3231|nr:hypothetical protein [Halioxenophilus sp. WMMB6]